MSAHSNYGIIHDSKPEVDRWTTLERGIYTLLQREFQNYNEFSVMSNLKKYKPSEDAFIFGQKIGKIPELCEVYLRGDYVCEVSIFDSPSQALTKIQDGMIEMVQEKLKVKKQKEEVL